MKFDNNSLIIISSTIIALAILIGIISKTLPEQVTLVLGGGLVGIGTGLLGNLQRKNDIKQDFENNKENINEDIDKISQIIEKGI